jgi:hypothetical protein
MGRCELDQSDMLRRYELDESGSGSALVECSCKHGNESSGSI